MIYSILSKKNIEAYTVFEHFCPLYYIEGGSVIRKEGLREDPGIKGGLNRSGGIHIEREIFLGEYPGIVFAGNQPWLVMGP